MGYAQTDVLVYGVRVSCDEARSLICALGARAFAAQQALGFPHPLGEWRIEPWELEYGHDLLTNGEPAELSWQMRFTEIADFYDTFDFPAALVPDDEVEIISWTSQGRTYRRRRCFVDLVCDGADARGASLRLLPGRPSYFGVVLGSNGYGYRDDLGALSAPMDPRVARNFARYCAPEIAARGWDRAPGLVRVDQVW